MRILEVRAYEQTKQMVDAAKSGDDVPNTPLVEEAIERRLSGMHAIFKKKQAEAEARKRRNEMRERAKKR